MLSLLICLSLLSSPKEGVETALNAIKSNGVSAYYSINGIDALVLRKEAVVDKYAVTWDEMTMFKEQAKLFELKPEYESFLNLYALDYQDKTIICTYWTHGNYEQIIVLLIDGSTVKTVLSETYRDSAYLFWDPDALKLYLNVNKMMGQVSPADTYTYYFDGTVFKLEKIIKRQKKAIGADE